MASAPTTTKLSDDEVDRLFHALADATRRDIVTRTLRSDQSISALARGYAMSFAAVQKHVAVLESAGLVCKERRGREQLVRGEPQAIRRAGELLSRYEAVWNERAAGIERILADESTTAPTPGVPGDRPGGATDEEKAER